MAKKMNFSSLIGAFILGLVTSGLAGENKISYTHYRLPQNVRPINYNLTLKVDMEKDTFQGSVGIQLHITAPTSYIVIHANSLIFVKASLLRYFETCEKEEDIIFDHPYYEQDYWVLKLQNNVEPGLYFLRIEYEAKYKVYYNDPGLFKFDENNGSKLVIANTHGSKARFLLPCFDEPALKATFDVTVVYPHMDGYHALSTMDVKTDIEHGSSRIITFKRTPAMSPGNIGFVITNLPYKRVTVNQDGVGEPYELTIYVERSKITHVSPFLKYFKEGLEFFAQYTSVAYPLPKLDMVVVNVYHKDPIVGNWGLLALQRSIYNTSVRPLDVHDGRETLSLLAGMWFGNLVFPSWWKEFWLTSELSAFMRWKAIIAIAPNMIEISEYKAYLKIESAMSADIFSASYPLEKTVENFNEKYQLVREGKGLGFLMMTESVVGQDNFRQAISSLLSRHMYGIVTTSDLKDEMQAVYPDKILTKMMKSFTENDNYPIVTLEKLEDGSYKLKQNSYGEEYLFKRQHHIGVWVTPVLIKTVNASKLIWLKGSEYIIPELNADWAVISACNFGLYQTNYSQDLWLAIANALQADHEVLYSLDRVKLLKSVSYQIWIANLKYDIVFEILRFLEKETSSIVWDAAFEILENVRSLLKGDALYGLMKYGQQLIKNYYQTISWTEDNIDDDHYEQVLKFACNCELEDCLILAQTLLPNISVHTDMSWKDGVIATAAMKKTTDTDIWLKLWEAFDKRPNIDLYRLLMNSKDSDLLEKVLKRAALDQDVYRDPSSLEVFVDPELVWSLLREELVKYDKSRFEGYLDILEYGADPEIFAAIIGSTEFKECVDCPKKWIFNSYIDNAKQAAKPIAPAKKWLQDNGFVRNNGNFIVL